MLQHQLHFELSTKQLDAAMNALFCEQLHQFIMETINSTLHGAQASGAGPSSQLERDGTLGGQGMVEQIPTGLQ
ncbi:UNVERIFIED_CONTAM: hypothetical protein Sindi_2273700 [Sesamum indicum]